MLNLMPSEMSRPPQTGQPAPASRTVEKRTRTWQAFLWALMRSLGAVCW